MATCLEYALLYASKGVHIFAGVPGTRKSYKSMKFSNGRPWGMTIDADEIKADWKRWPQANVCIVTGPASDIFVLDVDTLEGHGVDGPAALAALEAANGPLPPTRQAISPTGGPHYYFRYPKSGNIINSTNLLGPGLDVRGDGGMVLAPPSIKPAKDDKPAGEYKWANDIMMAQAPQWLLDLVLDKNTEEREPGEAQSTIEKVIAALFIITNDENTSWEDWNTIGMATWAATGGHEDGFKAFNAWSKKNKKKHDVEDAKDRWYNRYVKTPPTTVGFGKLWWLANEESPGWLSIYEEEHQIDEEDLPEEELQVDDTNPDDEYTIKFIDYEIEKAVDRTEELLIKKGVDIYRYSHTLVRPITRTVDARGGEKTSIAQLELITPLYMSDLAQRNITYLKYNGKKRNWNKISAPLKVMNLLMERKGHWKFSELAGIITTQTMRPDGSLLLKAGYDPATRLLLIDPPPMLPMPNNITRGDMLEALELLNGLLTEFPFADNASKTVGMSAFLTTINRGAYSAVPMHVNRAPVAGTGKSYLFDIVSYIAIGQPMPVMAAGGDNVETEKRLGSMLMEGQPLINIDNVNGELGFDALCQIITQPIVKIRVLSKSEMRTIENKSTTLFCTGNNIILVGDVTRRAIQAVLNPNMERPELREFKQDPVAMVLANRGAYIRACLIICKGYIDLGRPNSAKRLASLEGWSDTVRSALIWLGMADPVQSMETIRADDPQLLEHRSVLIEMASIIGEGYSSRTTAAEILSEADEHGEGYDQVNPKWPGFNSAISAVAKWRANQPLDIKKFGNWLKSKRDKIVDGLVLRAENTGHGAKWYIERMEGGKPQPPKPGLRDTPNVVQPNFDRKPK